MNSPGPATHRRGDIQGLRAVAVTIVVLYHADVGFSGGFIGVDVFFVISGFVITQLLLRSHAADRRIDFRTFYSRRAKRLLPALALMLAVVLPLSTLLTAFDAQRSTARTGVAATLFNANNYLAQFGVTDGYFTTGAKANPLLHTWSLSLEEQFYFAFPAFLAVLLWCCRGRSPRRALVVGIATATAGSFALCVAIQYGYLPVKDSSAFAFYLAPCRGWELGAGALLGVASWGPVRLAAAWRVAASTTGLAALLAAALTFDDATVFPGVAALLPVTATVLLLVGGTQDHVLARSLSRRLPAAIGDISYGWYLWHWPFIVFSRAIWPDHGWATPLFAALSLVPALLSYRYVEAPIRASGALTGRRVWPVAIICVALPLASCAFLLVGSSRVEGTDAVTAFRSHLDGSQKCDDPTPIDARSADRCYWPAGTGTDEVLLIGDSNAGQFSEAILAGARENGLALRIATSSSCPFLTDVQLIRDGKHQSSCTEFVERGLAWIEDNAPSVVIIAMASDIYIEDGSYVVEAKNGNRATSPAEKAEAWTHALQTTLGRVHDAGAEVILVHPIPKFREHWRPRDAAPLRLMLDSEGFSASQSRPDTLRSRERAVDAERKAALQVGVSTLDVFDRLCPGSKCTAISDGVWHYRDEGHLSVDGTLFLTKDFADAIRHAAQ